MKSPRQFLNLAHWQKISYANGPGKRYVLWLQGCSHHCPGCVNKDMQPFLPRHITPTDQVLKDVAMTNVEGISFTGGEPFHQAKPLGFLAQELQEIGFSVFCFTGYLLEELEASNESSIERLLGAIDILVDGPFILEMSANLRWRGSKNQRIHFLSDRYVHLQKQLDDASSQIEVEIGRVGFTFIGNWPQNLPEEVERMLNDETGARFLLDTEI